MSIYFTDSYGENTESLNKGLDKIKLILSLNDEQVGFATGTSIVLENSEPLKEFFGYSTVAALLRGEEVTINGIHFRHITEATFGKIFTQIIFAPNVSLDFLEKLTSQLYKPTIIFIPWNKSELEKFKHIYHHAIML